MIVEKAGPHASKRLARVSRRYREAARAYENSSAYARALAASAISYMTSVLTDMHNAHGVDDDLLKLRVRHFVGVVATNLAKCEQGKQITAWGRQDLLNFLYPVSLCMPTTWPDAPFALSWCAASNNNHAIGAVFDARPLCRLASVADASCWHEGICFVAVARAACDNNAPHMRDVLIEMIERLAAVAVKNSTNEEQLMLAASVWVVSVARIRAKRDIKCVMKYLAASFATIVRSDTDGTTAHSAMWLEMVGMALNQRRFPQRMLSEFNCQEPFGEENVAERAPSAHSRARLNDLIRLAGSGRALAMGARARLNEIVNLTLMLNN